MREISLHILDLVQNSVEARATKVSLFITEDTSKDFLTIKVLDNGHGMTKELIEKIKNPFVTTRTTRKVGLGLPLIDMSTKMSNGYLTIQSKVGEGTEVLVSYQHSHIDRPPLGDILSTIKIIVISYQQIDFYYEHKKNDKSFVVDTKEIKTVLGEDIDFNEQLFRQWLDDYLKDGLRNLN